MALDQLMGRYFRLRQALATAYRAQRRDALRVEGLAIDVAITAREIACVASVNRATFWAHVRTRL